MSSIIFTPDSATTLEQPNFSGRLPQKLFTRRELIPTHNDILWLIERGVVRTVTWSEEGTFITLGYWGPGDVIGYALTKVKPYQIECLSSVEVTTLPPHIWHEYTDALLTHIQNSEELLSIVHRKPISLRLWHFLLWLSARFGQNVEQGRLIELYITHQEIAEVLNTTRVTITKLLQDFETAGMLLRSKRRIILRSSNN